MNYFKHELAVVGQDARIGLDTKIWAFAHILSGAEIGKNCNICDHTFIESDVAIGDNVTIKCGVYIWDGVVIEDNVFIGPNVTFTNDSFPQSKKYPEKFEKTVISKGASIGAGAVLLPVCIGENAMVGAGSVVTKNIPPNAIVVGNPAKVIGYVDTEKVSQNVCSEFGVGGGRLRRIKTYTDIRGSLLPVDLLKDLPFNVKRTFFVYGVESGYIRGEHAHKECHQFLFCIKGSVSVVCDDGVHREEYLLDNPNTGVYIEPGVWGIQYKYSKEAILCVMASHEYDSSDYIRNYQDFLNWKNMDI